jgi:Ca-activated chloride channel family protein
MIAFERNELVPWLLLVVPMAWMLWRKIRWQEAQIIRWYPSPARRPRSYRVKRWFRWLKGACLLAAIAGLGVALARPILPSAARKQAAQGLDLLILLDISPSMRHDDIKPSRWEQAMLLISSLQQLPAKDRIALIAFSGEAGLQCPWTEDHIALQELAWQSKIGLFPSQGDGLSDALRYAAQLFARPQPRPAPRAILLLSDGFPQENGLNDALHALRPFSPQWLIAGLAQENTTDAPAWESAQIRRLRDLATQQRASYLPAQTRLLDQITAQLQRLARHSALEHDTRDARPLFPYPLAASLLFLFAFVWLTLRPAESID